MTKKQKSILIAMSIGDGHLHKYSDTKSVELMLAHSTKQKDYLIWKVNLARRILGGKPNKIAEFNNNYYPGIRWSKADNYFRIIRKWLYKNGKKVISKKILDKLTPMGIAIWYMDDGNLTLHKRNRKIHAREIYLNTYCSKNEAEIIQKWFMEKYNIRFRVAKNKGKFRLACNTANTKRFIKIVKPYIIPSMQYKIDMRY